jgi:DNA-binding XRE family transcriptional regulator
MQAVVKAHHIEIKAKGNIPPKVIKFFKDTYGSDFRILTNSDEREFIDITESEGYKKTKKTMTPGDYLRTYRDNAQLSQSKLGNLLEGFSRQNISEMEKGKRGISKETAKKLAKIFNKPVEKFL